MNTMQTTLGAMLILAAGLLPHATLAATTYYSDAARPDDTGAGTSWATAKKTIQAAVDLTVAGDTVLVTNGVYSTGGKVTPGSTASTTSRVVIAKAIMVRSVNGPDATIIQGWGPNGQCGTGAVRGVYLANATLVGFTITNGFTHSIGNFYFDQSGGGALLANGGGVSNCVISTSSAYNGGGAYLMSGGTIWNSRLSGNSAGFFGGGAYCRWGGTLRNCTLSGNSASNQGGGGVYCVSNGTLQNCILSENVARFGGGGAWCEYGGTFQDCVFTGNTTFAGVGGGLYCYRGSTLQGCTLIGNIANGDGGGGAYCHNGGTLRNCTLSGNTASANGGGIYFEGGGTLHNCVLSGNSADNGGGAYNYGQGTLLNCTLTANNAKYSGGGFGSGGYSNRGVANCIIYDNTAPSNPNYSYSSSWTNCCSFPMPSGTGNITNYPQFARASHIAVNSPCIGRGNYSCATGVDIDGQAWKNPPSIGCDEVYANALTGALKVAISAPKTAALMDMQLDFMADIQGIPASNLWTFGDGAAMVNKLGVSHAWSATGGYVVVLTAFNSTYPQGVAATVNVLVVTYDQSTRYVNKANMTPSYPFGSWATAATNIQDAVDAVPVGGEVLVTNGVYDTGGALTPGSASKSRVMIAYPLTLRSVKGPDVTIIQGWGPSGNNGAGAVRGVYLCSNTILSGFTVTSGRTQTSGSTFDTCGGGVFLDDGGLVSNCVVNGNRAYDSGGGTYCYNDGALQSCTLSGNSANWGGGAYYGTLQNCTASGNSANLGGGGMYGGKVQDCTLSENSAYYGGGACQSTLQECILSGNSSYYGGGACDGTLINCTVRQNLATNGGGFCAWFGTLQNCVISENIAEEEGGGVYDEDAWESLIQNCTLTANKAKVNAGGIQGYYAVILNSIVYDNIAPSNPNWQYGNWTNSCTAPLPSGLGNITNDPQLVNASHIATISPCVGAGNSAYATGVDIDGQAWKNPPSMGCDEVYSDALTGALRVAVMPPFVTAIVDTELEFMSDIQGMAASNVWIIDGSGMSSNKATVRHAWGATGTYLVILTAFNTDYPQGVAGTSVVTIIVAPFLDITNGAPVVVKYGSSTCAIGGTNNVAVAGNLWWSNATAGVGGPATRANATAWSALITGLAHGANAISVYATNLLSEQAQATIGIHRQTFDEAAPQIATNALIFPARGSILSEGLWTNIIWNPWLITDDVDCVELRLTRISIHDSNTLAELAWVTNDVANTNGLTAWLMPDTLVGDSSIYLVRFEVADSSALTNSRVFFDNPFTVVPESAIAFVLALTLATMAAHKRQRHLIAVSRR